MQSRAVLHVQVASQTALDKEVRGKLNSAAETGTDHSCVNTTVNALDTLSLVNFAESIP